jgi:hypothetical protein
MNARHRAVWLLLAALLITTVAYWPGLSGSWLFDDYPNIVDNPGVQPHEASMPALVRAALSSPASEFKRPLASLSFAANYLADGLNPFSWKLANLVIHLLNGLLVFVLGRGILYSLPLRSSPPNEIQGKRESNHEDKLAALIAAGWMLLPINLTAVLYVVQREESMANLFVMMGLIGYVAGRRRMLEHGGTPLPHLLASAPDQVRDKPCMQRERQKHPPAPSHEATHLSHFHANRGKSGWAGFLLCAGSLILPTAIGLLAKETAVMLPLYAFLIEWIVFGFCRSFAPAGTHSLRAGAFHIQPITHKLRSYKNRDIRIGGLFVATLILPMAFGVPWLLPQVLPSAQWATRDFTLSQRLLSEARVVCDYIAWTLLPTPHALSFYHDQFRVSTSLLKPWTTLASLLVLACLMTCVVRLRKRHPMASLGIALFLGCQLLTGTLLPLELVYEHRNYFASFGLLLVVMPWLSPAATGAASPDARAFSWWLPRRMLLACLLLWWVGLTAITAYAWGDPLRLAQELAARAPDSPRAQYELGRTYIIYSHYDPASPYTRLAYAPLERAAAMPESSILPQQALIFMNSRMGLPLKSQWWDSLIAKLKARKPGVQDESSLAALTQCARDRACPLPTDLMMQAFKAALAHPAPSARLQATYGDYAWNALGNHTLGLRMIEAAVKAAPSEPAYRITLVRMLLAEESMMAARSQLQALQHLNIGGRLNTTIRDLQLRMSALTTPSPAGSTRP